MAPITEGGNNIPKQAFVQYNDPKGTKLISLNRDGTIDCLGLDGGAAVAVNDPVAIAAGKSGAIQTIRVPYMLTEADILLGYAVVPITWPHPWPDLNETNLITVCNPDQTDGTDFAPGAIFSRSLTGVMAILNLTAAIPIVQGQKDYNNVTAGQSYSFQTASEGLFQVNIVVTGVPPQSVLPGAQLELDVKYTDNVGPQALPDIVAIADDLAPEAILQPIYSIAGSNIAVNTAFTMYAVQGSIPANSFIVPGSFTSGSFAYEDTITQASSGATATFYGVAPSVGGQPSMFYVVTNPGTGDDGSAWTEGGNTFTPTGPVAVGGWGAGFSQFVTGAFGPQQQPPDPSGPMYIGPHVSGVADIPSGDIDLPGPLPDDTHAWYDNAYGGLFIPTSGPVPFTFPYNLHIRIVQIPNNSTIYQAGQLTYLNVVSIHD